MALQYLDTLKSIGQSPSTKYIFPLEFTSIFSKFREYFQGSDENKRASEDELEDKTPSGG